MKHLEKISQQVANLWWRVKGGRAPSFSEFAGKASDHPEAVYRGTIATLFFANTGRRTGKWLHYLGVYDKILDPFVNTPARMLEIGVSGGGSLQLWRKFLGRQAVIFGIDVDPQCAPLGGDDAVVRIGSQDDPEFLRTVIAEMGGLDVVVDDGSHIASHQRASFEALFPLLSDGGIYVLEDLHTSYWPRFEGGLRRRGTAIEYLKAKIDSMHAHYQRKGVNRAELIEPIESIQFFDSIAVVTKRQQTARHHFTTPAT
jgi:cephalosporin hydroxylase